MITGTDEGRKGHKRLRVLWVQLNMVGLARMMVNKRGSDWGKNDFGQMGQNKKEKQFYQEASP